MAWWSLVVRSGSRSRQADTSRVISSGYESRIRFTQALLPRLRIRITLLQSKWESHCPQQLYGVDQALLEVFGFYQASMAFSDFGHTPQGAIQVPYFLGMTVLSETGTVPGCAQLAIIHHTVNHYLDASRRRRVTSMVMQFNRVIAAFPIPNISGSPILLEKVPFPFGAIGDHKLEALAWGHSRNFVNNITKGWGDNILLSSLNRPLGVFRVPIPPRKGCDIHTLHEIFQEIWEDNKEGNPLLVPKWFSPGSFRQLLLRLVQ